MSVLSVLALAVRPGAEEDLVRVFTELSVFEHAREGGGFLGGRLLRPLAAGEPFLVLAEWESAEAYERWLRSPLRARLAEEIEPLLSERVARGGLYAECG